MDRNVSEHDNKGFTLVEVIFSLALLGIIAILVLPVFNFAIQSSVFHRQSMSAAQIASNQLEWLRTLDYEDELGLVGGYTPDGIVDENLFQNRPDSDPYIIDGMEYRVRTRIAWDDDTSITGRQVDDARKKADIVVYAYNPFTKTEREFSLLGTMFTFEGQGGPTLPGIRVVTYKRVLDDENRAQRVLIEKSGAAFASTFTDYDGRAIFPNLPQGTTNTYTIIPKLWDYGEIMVRPNDVENVSGPTDQRWVQHLTVTEVPNQISFVVDSPARLDFYNDDGFPDSTNITIESDTGDIEGIHPITVSLNNVEKLNFWPVWTYEYTINKGNENFYIAEEVEDEWSEWEGKFTPPNNSPSIKGVLLHFGFDFIDEQVDKSIKEGGFKFGTREITIEDPDDPDQEIDFSIGYVVIEISFTAVLDGSDLDREKTLPIQFSSNNFVDAENRWTYELDSHADQIYYFASKESLLNQNNSEMKNIISDHLYSNIDKIGYSIERDGYDPQKMILTIVDTRYQKENNKFSNLFKYASNNKGGQLYINIPNSDDFDDALKSTSAVPLWGYSRMEDSMTNGILLIDEN
ncbi:hypothetical protein Amet_3478 [Alkaliphilus metalliredigens QYMF]|uniref:Prepilin-type N-terminal cleavage/methylation domain-containing protein n=1 Tax=Alkaliphilus metalliredigens (strain QYMF) TaxID=293826 RepID=A6TTT8_ALKMQ|nr:type II secretion system protein [Alkaliphilus metalliredigens]ABR49606.1 hypothetical protein Amet_3478 [Alkaliphilus metalliredigens QYMF]